MARPRFQPDGEQRKLAKMLSAFGISQEDIARQLGISEKTLRKHFRDELSRGQTEVNAKVSQTLLKMATSGNHPVATMFWLKARAGWCDRPALLPITSTPPPFVVAKKEEPYDQAA